jgi:hypothetical protein
VTSQGVLSRPKIQSLTCILSEAYRAVLARLLSGLLSNAVDTQGSAKPRFGPRQNEGSRHENKFTE